MAGLQISRLVIDFLRAAVLYDRPHYARLSRPSVRPSVCAVQALNATHA